MASRLDPPRPSAARLPAARRRRQLLDVAVDTFAVRGFHRTSMDELAEAAGVTKPVVYQHFPSKRHLYRELLEDVGSRLVTAVTGAVATASGPRQQVEAGFAAYFHFVARQTSAFTLLFGSGGRRDEEFADTVRKVEDRMATSVAALIEAHLAPDHREVLGYAIVGLAETTARHWVSGAGQGGRPAVDDEEAARLARRIAELAWAGLRGVHRD